MDGDRIARPVLLAIYSPSLDISVGREWNTRRSQVKKGRTAALF